MTLFQGKYRVQPARLSGWDYSTAGWYFVTICTQGSECFFGDVVDGEMQLSQMGEIAYRYWAETPQHFPNVELDLFVAMPNHVHGIVVIEARASPDDGRDVACNVSTPSGESTHQRMSGLSPKAGSLSVIVRSYKAAVTRFSRRNGCSAFAWQPRFYDHIIRNDESLRKIREYIANNPSKWELDKYYPTSQ